MSGAKHKDGMHLGMYSSASLMVLLSFCNRGQLVSKSKPHSPTSRSALATEIRAYGL